MEKTIEIQNNITTENVGLSFGRMEYKGMRADIPFMIGYLVETLIWRLG